MENIIKDLNWRYATKKFDPNKIISEEDLETIKESLRLVPTSYGLQPLKFLLIENKAVRERLVGASYNQQQVADASHLIVICSYKKLTEEQIDAFIRRISEARGTSLNDLDGYRNRLIDSLVRTDDPDQKAEWMRRQAYIALGQLLHTCATLRIDATPMEGFEAEKYNEILQLDEQNLHATLVCPIGYRHPEDLNQHLPKVRKTTDEIFEIIK